MATSASKPCLQLSEHIGTFIEYWGFKKVHGQVWTLIFLGREPVNARHLMESLQVSKALISMTIKDLLEYKVIFEIEKDAPGTQKYTYNPNIFSVVKGVLENRECKMLGKISEHIELLKQSEPEDKQTFNSENLQSLSTMTKTAKSLLSSMISQAVPMPLRLLKKALQLK